MASKNTRNLSKLEPQAIPLLALPFVPFAERKRLPRLAAIYFVLNARGTVLYVGQSINLALRWAAHHRATKLRELQATRIAWLVMEDTTLLDAVETACIAYFAPACNGVESGKGGRPATEAAAYVQITVRLPKKLLRELKASAHAIGRPMNTEIILLLEDALQGRHKRQRPMRRATPTA